jgi:cis-L-3-hydroxyproline dehydratase
MTVIPGRILVRSAQAHNSSEQQSSDSSQSTMSLQAHQSLLNSNGNSTAGYPLLITPVSLSFWGGIDPETGVIVDATHPLCGKSVHETIFCLPSGRGSSTASQVLLELILNNRAPRAIVMRDLDGMVTVGALIAQQVFDHPLPLDIVHVGERGFADLMAFQEDQQANTQKLGCVMQDGSVIVAKTEDEFTSLNNQHSSASLYNSSYSHDSLWQLTDEEERLLQSAESSAQKMAYQVIFNYAHLTLPSSASSSDLSPTTNTATTPQPSYRRVTKAHIDGCTYIGPGGLAFAQRLVQAGGKVVVPTTLNAMSTDRQQWSTLLVPSSAKEISGTSDSVESIANRHKNALALGEAYLDLGCQASFTCAPYLLANPAPPQQGDDICWGESNAVVFANSVLGARTEKYADYLDICCALVGLVPEMGMHIAANRQPSVLIDVGQLLDELKQRQQDDSTSQIDWDVFFPVLGHLCGSLSDGKVPLVVGLEDHARMVTYDHLKAFCAAFGTTGTSPLVHVAHITAEAKDKDVVQAMVEKISPSHHVTVTLAHLESTYKTLDAAQQQGDDRVDLIALGNPHLSVSECERLVELISSTSKGGGGGGGGGNDNTSVTSPSSPRKASNVRVMACISRDLYQDADSKGYISKLKDFGMEFISDTCWCMLLNPPAANMLTMDQV